MALFGVEASFLKRMPPFFSSHISYSCFLKKCSLFTDLETTEEWKFSLLTKAIRFFLGGGGQIWSETDIGYQMYFNLFIPYNPKTYYSSKFAHRERYTHWPLNQHNVRSYGITPALQGYYSSGTNKSSDANTLGCVYVLRYLHRLLMHA